MRSPMFQRRKEKPKYSCSHRIFSNAWKFSNELETWCKRELKKRTTSESIFRCHINSPILVSSAGADVVACVHRIHPLHRQHIFHVTRSHTEWTCGRFSRFPSMAESSTSTAEPHPPCFFSATVDGCQTKSRSAIIQMHSSFSLSHPHACCMYECR